MCVDVTVNTVTPTANEMMEGHNMSLSDEAGWFGFSHKLRAVVQWGIDRLNRSER